MNVINHKERVCALDAGRVLAMLGICVLHAVGICSPNTWWLHRPLNASVVYFVFITGYFGVTFRVKKLLRLIFIGVFWAFISAVFEPTETIGSFFDHGVRNFLGYWFLWAYVVLSIVAPSLNIIASPISGDDKRSKVIACMLVLLLAFGWNFAVSTFNLRIIPSVCGFGSHTPLTLIGIYLAARVYKVFETKIEKMRHVHRLVLFTACIPLILWRCNLYCSPVLLVAVAMLFSLFKKMDMSRVSGCVTFVLPSLFSVYLLHCTLSGSNLMNWLNIKCIAIDSGVLRSLIVGLLTFIVCIASDCLFRRTPIMLVTRLVSNMQQQR